MHFHSYTVSDEQAGEIWIYAYIICRYRYFVTWYRFLFFLFCFFFNFEKSGNRLLFMNTNRKIRLHIRIRNCLFGVRCICCSVPVSKLVQSVGKCVCVCIFYFYGVLLLSVVRLMGILCRQYKTYQKRNTKYTKIQVEMLWVIYLIFHHSPHSFQQTDQIT